MITTKEWSTGIGAGIEIDLGFMIGSKEDERPDI